MATPLTVVGIIFPVKTFYGYSFSNFAAFAFNWGLSSFGKSIQTHNSDIYNINKVIIQTQMFFFSP